MITSQELYLAAGFILGEGHFSDDKSNPRIAVSQVEKAPLFWLRAKLGGTVNGPYNRGVSPIYVWQLNGVAAAGCMMTLFPIMRILSPKRCREIKATLKRWRKRGPTRKNQRFCIHGHEFYQAERQRRCKTCITKYNRGRNAA